MNSDNMVRTRRKRRSGVAKRVADHRIDVDPPACTLWPVPEARGFDALEDFHSGRCGICGNTQSHRRLDEDHDHETGLVRGLLCRGCNLREGQGVELESFVQWRAGVNSATILGFEERRWKWGNAFPPYDPAEAHAAIAAALSAALTQAHPQIEP